MKRVTMTLAAVSIFAGPLAAQDQDTPADTEQPQMCEMMHNGERMQGMMMRGEDGTMTCRMMEECHKHHANMDHSQMQRGTMNHGHMCHAKVDHPSPTEGQADGPQNNPGQQDHSAHEGHTPS